MGFTSKEVKELDEESIAEIRVILRDQHKEDLRAFEAGEITQEEFDKRKRRIAKKLKKIRRMEAPPKTPSLFDESEIVKTPRKRPIPRSKPSNWWYLVPIFFNIFGGIIAYYAVRKDDYKKARNMLDMGGLMLLIVVVIVGGIPKAVLPLLGVRPAIQSTVAPPTTQPPTTTPPPPPAIQPANETVEKVFLNTAFENASEFFGSLSNYTDLQKEEIFNMTYRGRYVNWSGKVVEANTSLEGYNLEVKEVEPVLGGTQLIITLDWGQKEKLLSLKKGDEVNFTARLHSYGGGNMLYAVDGEIIS